MRKKTTIEEALDKISDISMALDDAQSAMQSAERMLEDMNDGPTGDVTTAVIDAVRLGLPMIEFKYGLSSKEAAEVRSFISESE